MIPIRVTDHAVVRYLEREFGVDVESVRAVIARKINSPAVQELVEFGGGVPCKVKVDGKTYCLCGNTVTTYIGRQQNNRPRRTTRKQRW